MIAGPDKKLIPDTKIKNDDRDVCTGWHEDHGVKPINFNTGTHYIYVKISWDDR